MDVFYRLSIQVCVCVHAHTCAIMHARRSQVASFLLPCRSQGSNSGYQPGWRACSSAEPSQWPWGCFTSYEQLEASYLCTFPGAQKPVKALSFPICSGKEPVKSTPTLKSTTQAFCPILPGLISLFKASLQAAVDYIVAVREGRIFQNTISYSLVGLSSVRLSESVVSLYHSGRSALLPPPPGNAPSVSKPAVWLLRRSEKAMTQDPAEEHQGLSLTSVSL